MGVRLLACLLSVCVILLSPLLSALVRYGLPHAESPVWTLSAMSNSAHVDAWSTDRAFLVNPGCGLLCRATNAVMQRSCLGAQWLLAAVRETCG